MTHNKQMSAAVLVRKSKNLKMLGIQRWSSATMFTNEESTSEQWHPLLNWGWNLLYEQFTLKGLNISNRWRYKLHWINYLVCYHTEWSRHSLDWFYRKLISGKNRQLNISWAAVAQCLLKRVLLLHDFICHYLLNRMTQLIWFQSLQIYVLLFNSCPCALINLISSGKANGAARLSWDHIDQKVWSVFTRRKSKAIKDSVLCVWLHSAAAGLPIKCEIHTDDNHSWSMHNHLLPTPPFIWHS